MTKCVSSLTLPCDNCYSDVVWPPAWKHSAPSQARPALRILRYAINNLIGSEMTATVYVHARVD